MLKPFLLSLLLFLLLIRCSDNGVRPPHIDELCGISDTTSHMVNWRVDTIGVFPSVLFDVVAIDANNVWAVGEIWTPEKDTVWNNDNTKYNAIRWNGIQYEYYQLGLIGYGSNTPTIQQLRVTLAFSPENIWFFSETGSYIHWNGIEWQSAYIAQRAGGIKAAWGVSSSDYYIVGNNGSISHYDGNSFTLMQSNTTVDLFDIDGYIDEESGEKHIWAIGAEDGEAVVLAYQDEQWINIWGMDLLGNYRFPHGLYISDEKSLVMSVWSGLDYKGRLYCFDQENLKNNKLLIEYKTYDFKLIANSINDIFLCGEYNSIEHFNGNTIWQYKDLMATDFTRSITLFDSKVYAVGSLYQRGLFFHGER